MPTTFESSRRSPKRQSRFSTESALDRSVRKYNQGMSKLERENRYTMDALVALAHRYSAKLGQADFMTFFETILSRIDQGDHIELISGVRAKRAESAESTQKGQERDQRIQTWLDETALAATVSAAGTAGFSADVGAAIIREKSLSAQEEFVITDEEDNGDDISLALNLLS
ncbi:hypothetical protein P7C73_g5226, partial [Tremellales sp. Uapishka_1]